MIRFRDKYQDFGEICREIEIVRKHNLEFKKGDDLSDLLLFSEALLYLLALERFLRIVPQLEATDIDTLVNLLEKATSKRRGFIKINDRKYIKIIKDVRNSIIHGNFEQAAQQEEVSYKDYFKLKFAGQVEELFGILNSIVCLIDPDTGKPI